MCSENDRNSTGDISSMLLNNANSPKINPGQLLGSGTAHKLHSKAIFPFHVSNRHNCVRCIDNLIK
ncbi:hypothetical protein L484_023410 [Morus notabilis]|uniref:Uncharacterized protein n=1 Tax=Morus notabilis TaxID=981085 RepID=W9S5K3_9ROSA|nr:hypothetical protein L484_023410 [Morus notabilis]